MSVALPSAVMIAISAQRPEVFCLHGLIGIFRLRAVEAGRYAGSRRVPAVERRAGAVAFAGPRPPPRAATDTAALARLIPAPLPEPLESLRTFASGSPQFFASFCLIFSSGLPRIVGGT